MQTTTPVTELPNHITKDIDITTPEGIVRILRQSDAQLFTGYSHYPSILDRETLNSITDLALQFQASIRTSTSDSTNNTPLVVFSGCGTSGRLAYFCSNSYNKCIKTHFKKNDEVHCFGYLMAGTDSALLKPQEEVEDDPKAGMQDLQALWSNQNTNSNRVFVGITCGLSAPYVAGQLDYLLKTSDHAVALIGFNPVDLARNMPMENWQDQEKVTFRQIAKKLDEKRTTNRSQYIILNPIVGPESITGSSRMKGGSATKILLDVAFACALLTFHHQNTTNRDQISEWAFQMLHGFETAVRYTYDHHELYIGSEKHTSTKGLDQLIERTAQSLRQGNHLYYIGVNNAGMLGFIDASECFSTYGTAMTDVRGFIRHGWDSIYENDQKRRTMCDYESKDEIFRFSFSHFRDRIAPQLVSNDSVIFIALEEDTNQEELSEMIQISKLLTCIVSWVYISDTSGKPMITVDGEGKNDASLLPIIKQHLSQDQMLLIVSLPHLSLVSSLSSFAEMALKLVLNAITTGAHILKGMIFGNRMINVTVSNNKLYYRSISIVSNVVNVSEEKARECIMQSIWEDQEPPAHVTVNQCVLKAVQVDKVVPVALLLASGACKTVLEARELLTQEPVVRNAVVKYTK
jgi:N-acetylmuramic acid 6-phosphate (MurNAc-6-P) etherase